jgi:thymidine kinase
MSRIWRKADLTFIYSVMKSGKSLDLLKNAHIHRERQQKVLLLTSEKDGKNRSAGHYLYRRSTIPA